MIQAASAQLEQFMVQSFAGFKYYNCEFPRCLLWGDSTPRGLTPDQRQTWIWFMRFSDGYYLKAVRAHPSCRGSQLKKAGHAAAESEHSGTALRTTVRILVPQRRVPGTQIGRRIRQLPCSRSVGNHRRLRHMAPTELYHDLHHELDSVAKEFMH